MAAELRSALLSVLDDPLFQLGSCEMEGAKNLAKKIAEVSTECSKSEDFKTFATSLVSSLERALTLPENIKCYTTRRERVWRSFHHKQEIELPLRWSSLFRDLGLSDKAPGFVLLTQHINQKLFEQLLTKDAMCADKATSSTSQTSFTSDELNALRYAAGYVPFALKKKLAHRPEFVKCLEQLEVKGEGDSYLAYTTEWIKLVNRGKLFQLSDEAFHFFCNLERKVGAYLHDLFRSTSSQIVERTDVEKKMIISNIIEDTDVHFSWLLLCLDLDDDELSKELLGLVTEMWITIRGFSMASAWIEYYKQSKEKCTKKQQGLRKGLKCKQLAQQLNNEQ